MKKRMMFAVAVVVCIGFLAGFAVAGNGKGPGDCAGVGPCDCGMTVDVDPADGYCDICGGCICDGDGPKGPGDGGQRKRAGDRKRDGSCKDGD